MERRTTLLPILFVCVLCSPALARTWKDASGRFEIEAELVKVADDDVHLRKKNGKVITVKLERLSRDDRAFLKKRKAEAAGGPAPADKADTGDTQDKKAEKLPKGIQLGAPVETRVVVGLKLTGVGGNSTDLVGSIAAPAAWPEQEVEIVDTSKSPLVRKVYYRDHPGGSQQMVVNVPRLGAGDTAEARVTFVLRRRPILPPLDTSIFSVPEKPNRAVRMYLQSTPGIQAGNAKIKKIADQLAAKPMDGWTLAKKTFDWVRENVEYAEGNLRGAVWAAQHGQGDCEEFTSLFIALCRANRIPARAVWIPSHCYPEFYLEDDEGQGHWFPCDPVSGASFGKAPASKPILQKGDSFRVPEKKLPQRYLEQTLAGNIARGGKQPQFEMILDIDPGEN